MTARELTERLATAGVVVTLPTPETIELDAVAGGALPPDLVAMAREHKAELLARLDFEQRADALLRATNRRIAAAWCADTPPLFGEAWQAYEDGITRTYHAQDMVGLCGVLTERERYALEIISHQEVQP